MVDKDFVEMTAENDDRYHFPDIPYVPGPNVPYTPPGELDPPVPNRAWTAMKNGKDIDALTEEEKMMLYYGRDPII